MTIAQMTSAKTALTDVLTAADLDGAQVERSGGLVYRGDSPAVWIASAVCSPDPQSITSGPARYAWDWNLDLRIASRRYLHSADEAQAEVEDLLGKVWAAVEADPQLQGAAHPPAGLLWIEPAQFRVGVATPPLDETVTGANMWECDGGLALTLHFRPGLG